MFKLIYTDRHENVEYVYLHAFFSELESVDPNTYDFFCRTNLVSLETAEFIFDPMIRVVPEVAIRVWRV